MSVHASSPALCGFRYAPYRLFTPDEALAYQACRAAWPVGTSEGRPDDGGCMFSDDASFHDEWMRVAGLIRTRERAMAEVLRAFVDADLDGGTVEDDEGILALKEEAREALASLALLP